MSCAAHTYFPISGSLYAIKVSPNLLKLDCFLLCNDWIVADYNSPRNKTLEVSIDEPEL